MCSFKIGGQVQQMTVLEMTTESFKEIAGPRTKNPSSSHTKNCERSLSLQKVFVTICGAAY